MKREKNIFLIKDVLEKYLSEHKQIGYAIKSQIALKAWETIIDDYFINHTKAVLVKDRILFVNTDSTALSNELALRENELLKKLNKNLNCEIIKRIVFRSGFTKKKNDIEENKTSVENKPSIKAIKHAENTVKSIKDKELKLLLKKFIIASSQRNKNI